MPHIFSADNDFFFPPITDADDEGLLMIGGSVTPARVIDGYPKGIFPWYGEDELPLWWSPDPRFVLLPKDLHVSKSMQRVLKKEVFQFKINTAFEDVIEHCANIQRQGQDGTWLTPEMKTVYIQLHKMGYAHSVEAWKNDQLVGGMYGLQIGNVFFGESMFSVKTNASKFAFIKFVQIAQKVSVKLIDCQVYTRHVESLGGKLIARESFVSLLKELC